MTVTVKSIHLHFVLNFALVLLIEKHYLTTSKIKKCSDKHIPLSCISNSKSISKSKQWNIYTTLQNMLSTLQSMLPAL